MYSETKPILFNCPREAEEITLHFVHDLHYGSRNFDKKRWEKIVRGIQQPNHYAIFLGDLMENATVGSKSDVLYQTCPPLEQRDWVVDQFLRIGTDKIVAVSDGGNHERRSAKDVGAFPIYDACLLAGNKLVERYRPHFALCDIGVGIRRRSSSKSKLQNRYVVFAIHKAKDLKHFNSADWVDGCDVFAFGHDHDPRSHPRASLRYDTTRKTISFGITRVVNCGANLTYGGYAADSAYRPAALVEYKVHLSGMEKATWVEER